MARQYYIFADWNPLDAFEMELLAKHKPDGVILGLNDEGRPWERDGFQYVGSERMRAAWGRNIEDAITRVVHNCMGLESCGIRPGVGLWYDATEKTNTDLLKWLPELWASLDVAEVDPFLS